MGLGQSLQQVGGMIGDYNKSKMRDRLEQEREQRQYERQLEKEARQEAQRLARPTEWKPVEMDGKWTQQAYNADGTILTGVTKDMTPTEIEEFNRQRNAADRQDKIDTLKLGKAEFEAGTLEEAWRMKRDEHGATMRLRQAQAASANRGSSKSSGGSSEGEPNDVRKVGLDAAVLNNVFAARNSDGTVKRDREGKVTIDDDKLDAFLSSSDYQEGSDANKAAARWNERMRRGGRETLRQEGLSEAIIDRRLRGDTDTEQPTIESSITNPEQRQQLEAMRTKVHSDIDSGRVTAEQAADELERRGWSQFARQIRVRYGVN